MSNLLKNKYFYFWLILFLFIGIGIGLPFSINDFSFSWKIELFDILTLVITSILAVYVAKSLEKRVQDDRVEKELHIEQINQIEKLLGELEEVLRSERIVYNQVISRISKIRIKKNNLFTTLFETITENKDAFKERTDNISSYISKLKPLLTDTSVEGGPEVIMRDGILSYSSSRISSINNCIYGLENELYRLKIMINRI